MLCTREVWVWTFPWPRSRSPCFIVAASDIVRRDTDEMEAYKSVGSIKRAEGDKTFSLELPAELDFSPQVVPEAKCHCMTLFLHSKSSLILFQGITQRGSGTNVLDVFVTTKCPSWRPPSLNAAAAPAVLIQATYRHLVSIHHDPYWVTPSSLASSCSDTPLCRPTFLHPVALKHAQHPQSPPRYCSHCFD